MTHPPTTTTTAETRPDRLTGRLGTGSVLARRGLLPAPLGLVHDKHQSPAVSSAVQTATALVLLGAFAVLGLDPLVGVFGSMAGVATVGMVTLMLTTSIAVLVFFTRHPELRRGRTWQTRIAPVLACVGLLASLWLVLTNFTLVTGGSATVSTVLALVPVAGLVIGIIRGQDVRVDRTGDDLGEKTGDSGVEEPVH